MSEAALALVLMAALAAHVALRREKSPVHWHFLALAAAILLWSGGAIWRYAATSEREVMAALRVMLFGVLLAPPLWLLLAARIGRATALERPAVMLLLAASAIPFYAAFLTNEGHQLYASELSGERVVHGSLFWLAAGWAYTCVLAGVAVVLREGGGLAVPERRPQAVLTASAALIPAFCNATYLLGVLPWPHDPTPLALAIASALLFFLVVRLELLDDLVRVRRDVLEGLRDGVVITDPSGVIVDVNPAGEGILRQGGAALRGVGIADALASLTQDGDPSRVSRLVAPLECGAEGRRIEIETRDERWVEVSVPGGRGHWERGSGRFVVLRDRTDDRRFEQLVRRSQKLESVGLLAAGIAHEVNNPLAFMRSNLTRIHQLSETVRERAADLGDKDLVDLDELPEMVEETLEGIERIRGIVQDLRGLSRNSDGAVGEVDLNEAVRDCLKLAELHRGSSVEVVTLLADELPPVSGSKERLIQVFLNLLLNAKQALAGRGRGRIVAESRRLGDHVEVRVADDGPGIPEELLERIFDPFFTTKGPGEGTGLGLPIAHDIVRDHGGVMEVTSRPGHGTCFSVRLPQASASVPARSSSADRIREIFGPRLGEARLGPQR